MESPKTHQTRYGTDVSYCGINRSIYVKSSDDPTCLRCQGNIEKEDIDTMFESRGKKALMMAIDEMSSDLTPSATMEELTTFSVQIARKNPQFQITQVADLIKAGLILIASGLVSLG